MPAATGVDDGAGGDVRRIRWVTPIAPDRDGGGGHIRQAHLLLALARDHAVDLVVAGSVRDEEVRAAVASITEVPPLLTDVAPSAGRRARDLRMATAARFHREVSLHAPVRRAVAARWDDLPPADVVNVELPAMAPLVRLRREERWILTMHNVRTAMAAQLASVTSRRRLRWLLRRDLVRADRFERWVPGAFDVVVVPSQDDAELLGGRCAVVPNGVDLDRFAPTPLPAAPRLLFTGALYTGPNIDGARWLAAEILPLVRRHVPAATLDIVGLRPSDEVRALGRLAGVTVHADVASVVPHLERCRVACVPLRVGTGTRLKALEAMAAGRPVVGTSVGLAGLDLDGDRQALVRDDADGFAGAVVRVLTDDGVASRLVASASDHAARFGWDRIGADFVGLVDGLGRTSHAGRPA